jgi:diguanylate cyclase (GGDEF)-like protein
LHRLKAWLVKQSSGVNQRIVYGLVGGLLLCLWGFVGFWSWWERHSILNANAQVLDQLSTAVHEQTRSLFKQAETSLIVARHWMAEHPDQDPGKAPDFIRLIDELRLASDGLIDIRMVTRDGTLRYIPDLGQTRETNVSDRDYFQAQFDQKTRGLFVAQPVVSRVTGKLGIPISMPVTQAGGKIAVIFAAIELDRIAGSFEAERIQPHGTIAMLRIDGLFLFRSPMDAKIIGSSVAQSAMWRRHMGATPKGHYHSEISPVDGLSRVVTYMRVQDYPLVVAVSAAVEDLLDEWRKNTAWVVLVASVISAFSLVLGSILLRTMQKEALARRELERLMLTDPLTGVGNRRMLELRLEDEILRARRYHRALTAVYLDLDHFKQVNDKHGHDVGDTVLRLVADSLVANVRQSDHVARLGGEEFVVLLTETGLDDAVTLVERMRTAVAALQIHEVSQNITISAGLAQWCEGENGAALLRRADQALYRAKSDGRNRAFADTQV